MKSKACTNGIHKQRRAGVLLHPTSLPGYADNGDIGHQAYRFIEFLSAHGFGVWQMLPLGPTHEDRSPYQCLSAHAGNPLLVSLEWLVDRSWLHRADITESEMTAERRYQCLHLAAKQFHEKAGTEWLSRLDTFYEKHRHWLDDYTLFMALKNRNGGLPWYEWPEEDKLRDPESMSKSREVLAADIRQIVFEQFIFFTQWQEIREYADRFNVELFGDMPIFVARDSAEVWAEKDNFLIDDHGEMIYVAGVPPDAFSDTGQRWGNPLYDWEFMQKDNYRWWKLRFETQLELFDILRIDHFRGLQACWHIPADEAFAINGEWVEVPGKSLLKELFETFDYMPLVAEDLGVITDEVIALKQNFDLPGMKVLHFAFDGNTANPHLPHNHLPMDLVYTGTHDNDTSLGWVTETENYNREFYDAYVDQVYEDNEEAVLAMIRLAMASVSFLCILPMQDLLMLGTEGRMNMPGTLGGNWQWRFEWDQLRPDVMDKVQKYMRLYQR